MSNDHKHVDPQDPALPNSPILEGMQESGGLKALAAPAICYWNGEEYSDGATICSAHRIHKCWNGKWAELGSC